MKQFLSSPRTGTLSACLMITMISGLAIPVFAQSSKPSEKPTKRIKWNSGVTETPKRMSVSQVSQELGRLSSRDEKSHVVVYFQGPISKVDRDRLSENGMELQSPLGGNAYFASVTRGMKTDAVSGIVSVSSISKNHKLHLDLAVGIVRPWMVQKNAARGDHELQMMLDGGLTSSEAFSERGMDPTVAVLVMFHKDEKYQEQSKRLADQLGGTVVSEMYSVNSVTMHLPLSRIGDLAADDSVQWVEPPLPPMEDLNAENRVLVGANTLNASPYALDGSGVNVLVYDGGQVRPHADFGARLTVGASDTDSTSNHATHVAGTIGGDGTVEYANRGMAPGVSLFSYGFEVEGGLQPGFLYSDPGDIESDYTEALALYSVDIANNSIGTNIEPNGYPCEWTGNYGITSSLIDSIVRGSLGEPMRIVWANGNERSRSRCLGDDFGNHGEFYSTAPPANAKNHITVGSVDSDTDLISYFSSWGPTDDGRIKPDISAPGCESVSGVGVISTTVNSSTGDSQYSTACGTSMAAPTVTGVCALILEQYRMSFPTRNDPMNATLKALLANTAVDRGNVGPDYSYGYGSIRGVDAVNTILKRDVIEGEVGQGGVYRFQVTVNPGELELRVTIAWDDIPGAPNVSQSLINDLDLRVLDWNGAAYLPWTLDPSDPGAPAVQTQSDHLNNIEQVHIANPVAGVYTVEVTGTSIADAGTQTFGAVASGKITDCSSEGYVSMSESVVPCGDGTVDIRVTDCDLNASDLDAEFVNVLVTSETQPGGVVLTLEETEPNSAVFVGTLAYNTVGGADLQVSDGDTITASYDDLDTGSGSGAVSSAMLVVDCSPPVVMDRSVDRWYNSATVHVETDDLVSCRIMYGQAESGLTDTLDSHAMLSTTHAIVIPNLTELSGYVYSIEVTDVVGNVTVLDNGGAGFAFTTIRGPIAVQEYLVDDTDPGWDRTGDWEFGHPTGLKDNPSEAPTGENIFGYDLDNWFPWHMDEEYLTTDPIDLTGVYEVRLDFERWLGMIPDVYGNAAIRFRVGDGEWETIWEFVGGRMAPTEWSHMSYLLPSSVDNQSSVQIRWVMGTSEIHIDECGWNIDDIVLTGVVPPPPCIADLNEDSSLNFFDVSLFLSLYGDQDPLADFSGDGVFNFFDVSEFLALFGSGCP